jgi:hypothetical protein
MNYIRTIALLLVLTANGTVLAQAIIVHDTLPIPQAKTYLEYEDRIQSFALLAGTTLDSSEYKTDNRTGISCIKPLRKQSSSHSIEPLILLLMALALLTLGIATLIK